MTGNQQIQMTGTAPGVSTLQNCSNITINMRIVKVTHATGSRWKDSILSIYRIHVRVLYNLCFQVTIPA